MSFNWLKRLFTRKPNAPTAQAELPVPDEPPDWALELLEAVQKVGRSQIKVTARIEALESKLEGGFTDLRSAITTARPTATAPAELGTVLDALDILDEARRALVAAGWTQAELGLAGVTERIERFLEESGLSRHAVATDPLDGKLFRVVGTVERTDLGDGALVQVIRAAALAGDRVVREGEVLINRRTPA